VLMLATLAACGNADAAQNSQQQQWGASAPFVQHPENIQPGMTLSRRFMAVTNPYDGNATRAAEGAKLFIAYNCLDCHGADGSGAMGPSLQDSRWHFGGSNAEVFESIYEGRPDGMPAWGGRISDADIWRLVTYARGLSKGHDVATENFTGKTIERTGH
jgi:mono/diheme cytochrome c family protein